MGSSDGCGRAKGWTNIANCIPDVVKRSAVKGICFIQQKNKANERKSIQNDRNLYIFKFDYQPKSRALATFFPRPALNKKTEKRKKPGKSKAEKPTKRTHSQGKSY